MTDVASTTALPAETEAEVEATPVAEDESPKAEFVFRGSSSNMVPGAALLFGGIMAFSMGMTDVYFAEAMAWTFAAWGLLLMYGGLMDIYTTYTITEDYLIIRNPMRPWQLRRTWDWGRINRLDVVVKRNRARENDVVMQVYYSPEGEIANEREDRTLDATLAQLIMERAGLSAESGTPDSPMDVEMDEKATYSWR